MNSIALPFQRSKENSASRFYDVMIMAIAFTLVGFSIVMVYSTTGVISSEKFGDPLYYVKRQIISAVFGVLLMFACARINVAKLQKISFIFFPIALLLLVATLMPGLGETAGGAKRWIKLPGLRFQPAETVKVFMVIFMAGYLARHEAKLAGFVQGVVKPCMVIGMVATLLLMQPDFGSSAVITLICMCMVAVSGVRVRYLVLAGLALLFCAGCIIIFSPYRMMRVVSFLSPWADASGKGYQLIQSLIAVGTGQVSGVGLGASQQKLFFLPAAHTDFIFSVIGEELGFIGCIAVLMLFLMFLGRGLYLASRMADDTFCFSLTVGLTLLIGLPALLNIGVVTGMLPTKGMVLPLIGYGGTSLVACLGAIGVLLAVVKSRYHQP